MEGKQDAMLFAMDGDYIRKLVPKQESVRGNRGAWSQITVMVPGGIPFARIITRDVAYRERILFSINARDDLVRALKLRAAWDAADESDPLYISLIEQAQGQDECQPREWVRRHLEAVTAAALSKAGA